MRHLKFLYNLIIKQRIATEKRTFLRIHPGFNAYLHESISYEKHMGWLDRYEIDNNNKTITLYYTGLGYEEFYSEMVQVWTFEKLLEKIVLNEKNKLIDSVENLLWSLSKTEFINLLVKIKNEIRHLSIHLEKYDEAKQYIFIKNTLNEITSYLDLKFGKNYEFLSFDIHSTNDVDKKRWLKLVADNKIDKLFNELLSFGLQDENTDIILLSSRWNNIRQDSNKGILDRDKYHLEFANIIKSLAEYVKNLD